MLTLDQLKEIRDAATLTLNLLHHHLDAQSSLCGQMRLLLALLADRSDLDDDEKSLIDQLIRWVYPEINLTALSKPRVDMSAPPEHVTTQWVIAYLDLAKSTFYKEVFKKILFPVEKIGNRSYYLKSEVIALMVRHEKGAWTYSKLARKQSEKDGKK